MINTLRKSPFLMRLVDPFQPTAEKVETPGYRFRGDSRWWIVPGAFGVAGLLLSIVGWFTDPHQFYFAYLVAWSFCLSLSIGALFFVIIQHLTKARWSVVVRRIAESLLWGFPLLAVLLIPILVGMHDLYHWTHEGVVLEDSIEYDEVIAGKVFYLNTPFFIARLVLYFAAWMLVSYKLYRLSVQEDIGYDPEIKVKQRRVSAWGLPLVAVTTAFASYDLLMSLDPHWFSTIFGVYFFAGAFLSLHATLALVAILLQRGRHHLHGVVTVEHYHDLGKFMFGFTVFWAYIAFSQYMLIWYANIPEETIWYRHRLEHGWGYFSATLLILHFILPFFLLLPRAAKRSVGMLSFMAIWILIMQWIDLFWIAMPITRKLHAYFHWVDFATWIGLFGLFAALFFYRLSRHSLVPRNDPYLPASLRFHNV